MRETSSLSIQFSTIRWHFDSVSKYFCSIFRMVSKISNIRSRVLGLEHQKPSTFLEKASHVGATWRQIPVQFGSINRGQYKRIVTKKICNQSPKCHCSIKMFQAPQQQLTQAQQLQVPTCLRGKVSPLTRLHHPLPKGSWFAVKPGLFLNHCQINLRSNPQSFSSLLLEVINLQKKKKWQIFYFAVHFSYSLAPFFWPFIFFHSIFGSTGFEIKMLNFSQK